MTNSEHNCKMKSKDWIKKILTEVFYKWEMTFDARTRTFWYIGYLVSSIKKVFCQEEMLAWITIELQQKKQKKTNWTAFLQISDSLAELINLVMYSTKIHPRKALLNQSFSFFFYTFLRFHSLKTVWFSNKSTIKDLWRNPTVILVNSLSDFICKRNI